MRSTSLGSSAPQPPTTTLYSNMLPGCMLYSQYVDLLLPLPLPASLPTLVHLSVHLSSLCQPLGPLQRHATLPWEGW
jgi:putative effector of murein hydrolase LrgA (UPF0299 family)